ncbi:Ankyrin-3 (ANK-3) (Ankyrin-G) [Durusdinium trenchii]|uniref:Ankyrin-3 (ANK-3) (Ankyrin-G) n=1 Tax=Durusdinium trenchii TaxID=1381693 RepID=A0ABP0P9K0_9DINO
MGSGSRVAGLRACGLASSAELRLPRSRMKLRRLCACLSSHHDQSGLTLRNRCLASRLPEEVRNVAMAKALKALTLNRSRKAILFLLPRATDRQKPKRDPTEPSRAEPTLLVSCRPRLFGLGSGVSSTLGLAMRPCPWQYEPLNIEDPDDVAPQKDTKAWKRSKECFTTVLCLVDFVSDVLASQANAHSSHGLVKKLGYFGAALLLVSVIVNTCVVWRVCSDFAVWKRLTSKAPVASQCFRLLASTNPEVLLSFFALMLDGSFEDEQVLLAGRSVKKWGLLSQLFEDVPQFGVQAASLTISWINGWPVTMPVVLSVCFTLVMLFLKVITNSLVLVLRTDFQNATLERAAMGRAVAVCPRPDHALHLVLQAALASGNVVFLRFAGPIPLPDCPVTGQDLGIMTLLVSYLIGVFLVLALAYSFRERLWHCILQLELSALLMAIATVHPVSLLQIDPGLPKEAGCCWTGFLVLGPLLRCLAMASLAAWGVWRSDFPVPENACIALLVGNVLGILQLIIFLDEAKGEAHQEVKTFKDLEDLEREQQEEVNELLAQLHSCSRLRDLPDVLSCWEDLAVLRPLDRRIDVAYQLNEAFNKNKSFEARAAVIYSLDAAWEWKMYAEAKQIKEDQEEARQCLGIVEAARTGRAGAVRHFLGENPRLLEEKDASSRSDSLLHLAAREGHAATVEVLLEKGIEFEKNNEGNTALHLAVSGNHASTVRVLRDDLHISDALLLNEAGDGAVHLAACKGHWETIEALQLETHQIRLQLNRDGDRPLALAAWYGHDKIVELLISLGKDEDEEEEDELDHKDANRYTALHLAAQEGHNDVVKHLLKARASIRQRNDEGQEPLHLAAWCGRTETVNHLVFTAKADLSCRDEHRRCPLALAAWEGHSEVVKLLVDAQAEVNDQDKDGDTALHLAAMSGHNDVVKFLVDADVLRMKNEGGRCPLALAAWEGHCEVVKLLVDAQAEANDQDKDGDTALHLAAMSGHNDVVKLLVDRKAFLSVKNEEGSTPLDVAKDLNDDVRRMLQPP